MGINKFSVLESEDRYPKSDLIAKIKKVLRSTTNKNGIHTN